MAKDYYNQIYVYERNMSTTFMTVHSYENLFIVQRSELVFPGNKCPLV